ncbi:epimerase [Deinococcus arenae]|uniref:Epimerase n=1 Tax=Deinococcus arenae TaxID=1452751 RepID=A0A8H9GN94_9DEIO|nr:SDR family NAD(P)-dependent oxidoreductase [Deinococcus arenae]AWT35605.1 short-chain dehydrogenase [Deinococcus actinosclerus]GGM33432.1 epimerase [Deinococcus arenae]
MRRALLSPPACRDLRALRAAVAGRAVLVTGASSGVGEATALRLGAAGATVLLLARREARLREVAAQIEGTGGRAVVIPADLSDPASVDGAARVVLATAPVLTGVVSNAGRSVRRRALDGAPRADLERLLAVNVTGPARLLLALRPALGQSVGQSLGAGSVVVNVSSVSARHVGAPRWGAYQGSKAAFDLWMQAAVAEWPGVRGASVYLPLVRTPMIAPTRTYRRLPALSAAEAAEVVTLPFVRRVVRVAPWWLPGAEVAGIVCPGVLARGLAWAERVEARLERRA